MALATYADLQSAVSDYIERADMAGRVPDWITLFEAVANRRLRTRAMETSTTLTPSDGSVTLPTDYLTWRRVTWTGSTRVELEYVHPSILQAYYPTTPSATPAMFTIEGSTLKIRPTDATDLEFDYYQTIAALSGTVNWLYTAHPDLYLSGTLTEAFSLLGLTDKMMLWKARRDELFEEIKLLDRATKGPGAIRVMGYTP